MKNKKPPLPHTPTPWELIALAKSKNSRSTKNGELGDFLIRHREKAPEGIAITIGGLGKEEEANAEFIVRAVNSHKALLEAAKLFVDRHRQIPAVPAGNKCMCGDCSRFVDAIAAAEGK